MQEQYPKHPSCFHMNAVVLVVCGAVVLRSLRFCVSMVAAGLWFCGNHWGYGLITAVSHAHMCFGRDNQALGMRRQHLTILLSKFDFLL